MGGAVLATVGVIAGLTALGRVWPWGAQLVGLGAALAFLYLPRWILAREGTSLDDMGMGPTRLGRQLLWAAGVALVVFPLFSAGYHGVQTRLLERESRFEDYPWRAWDEALEGRPADLARPAPLRVWTEGERLHVFWHAPHDHALRVELELDAPPAAVMRSYLKGDTLWVGPLSGRGEPGVAIEGGSVRVRATGTQGLRLDIAEAQALEVRAWRGDERVPPSELVVGRWEQPSGGANFDRSAWWWLWLVLTHVILVAYPEEVFYRGYVQSRLDQLFPARTRLFGARVGPGLLGASALFALGHVLVDLDPTRAEVFFPALLFGWLRNRTDSVVAPAALHAASNILLVFLSRGYTAL